ncbi:class F sortase [Streptomyces sp. NPDC006368]|uniref:class F sortase n=1 Tax=Streptomyces sp. NPDC006368 TaxID=3156760 RepID=UPI0033A8729F
MAASPQHVPPGTSRTAHRPGPIARALRWPALAVALGALLLANSAHSDNPLPRQRPASVASAPASPAPALTKKPPAATGLALPRSLPTRLTIPQIAVDAPFTPLSLDASRQLEVPPAGDKNLVGWFEGGVTPGEIGSAIVVGHLDTSSGPAVFAYLDSLQAGSTVHITRQDKSVATFEVDSVETYRKADFPSDRVYADTPSPQLRLITCGGSYDRRAKAYDANVVVFAHLASVTKPKPTS